VSVASTIGVVTIVTLIEGSVTVTYDVTVSSDVTMSSLGLAVSVAFAVRAILTTVVISEVV